MTRFFIRPDQIAHGRAHLEADDVYHLRVVLKAMPGEPVAVLDGTGREWPGMLAEIGKSRAVVTLKEPFLPQTEPLVRVTVAQALPKVGDKMEQVLQHGTEVGAAAFWAFQSARSQTHLTGERQQKRLVRWQAIVKTAAEQSHRARLPEVRAEGTLSDVLRAAPDFSLTLLAHPETAHTLKVVQLPDQPVSVLIIIGPESGFSEAEVAEARAAGVQSLSLGPRILRTETAALALLAQLLYAMEDAPTS